MSDPIDKIDPAAVVVVGALALTAAGALAVAFLSGRKESNEELVDRLITESLRCGDGKRPWHRKPDLVP